MANNEINDLTAKTTPVSTDEVEIQETAGGLSKKATVGNLAKGMSYNDLNDKPTIPSGDVTGPASSTDNAIPRFDGTGGKTLQASTASVSDTGTLESAGNILAASGTIQAGAGMLTDSVGEWTPAAGVTVDGVLIKDGEVDGRDVSVDGTKLDGIESNATADQSAAEIKTAYESNLNTNAFTDAEQTKLSGIETGADVTDTANVTAAGALMDSEVDADIKTLSLPANTTISTFGASLIDDAAASNARTTLGLGTISTLAAPSGSVVGTSDTQTLTNKTISGTSNTISNIGPSQRTGGFYIGTISGATLGTTGNKAITGVGFTPKLVTFQVNPNGGSTTTDIQGSGAMTASSQYYQTTCSNGAIGYRNGDTSNCIGWITTGGATPLLLASYVSMDSDGFTINVSSAASTFPVSFIAYG